MNTQIPSHLLQSYQTSSQNFVRYFVQLLEQELTQRRLLADEQLENILHALHLAHTLGLDEQLLTGATGAYPLLERRGLFSQAYVHLQRAEAIARAQAKPHALLAILLCLAKADQRTAAFQAARTRLNEGVALAERVQALDLAALFHQALANLFSATFEFDEAEYNLNQAMTYARQLGESRLLTELLVDRVWLAFYGSTNDETNNWLQAALTALSNHPDAEIEMLAQGRLGVILLGQSRLDEATHALSESLRLARMLNHTAGLSFALQYVGVTSLSRGRFADAEREFTEAYELARRSGLASTACFALGRLSELASLQNNYTQARHYLDEGLRLAEQFSSTTVDARRDLLTLSAVWAIRQHLLFQAELHLEQAMPLAYLLNRPYPLGSTLLVYGNLRALQGDWAAAEYAYSEALTLMLEGKLYVYVAQAKIGLGQARYAQGDKPAGLRLIKEGFTELEKIKSIFLMTEMRRRLAASGIKLEGELL